MSETIWNRKNNWVGSQIEDSFVMLNFENGQYVSLNATATDVWNALETPKSAHDIANSLTEIYNIQPNQCLASIDRLLGDLKAKGLIEAGA